MLVAVGASDPAVWDASESVTRRAFWDGASRSDVPLPSGSSGLRAGAIWVSSNDTAMLSTPRDVEGAGSGMVSVGVRR
jgi:hypothetical protein